MGNKNILIGGACVALAVAGMLAGQTFASGTVGEQRMDADLLREKINRLESEIPAAYYEAETLSQRIGNLEEQIEAFDTEELEANIAQLEYEITRLEEAHEEAVAAAKEELGEVLAQLEDEISELEESIATLAASMEGGE